MTKIIHLVIFFMEQKEKKLVNSAKILFGKYWPKKTSIDEIVNKAWISKGAFYLYFKNKEDLFKKIIYLEFQHSEKMMKDLFEKFPEIKERLVNYLVWSIYYFKKNEIIRNMVLWNSNYYIWEIDIEYLEKKHMKLLHILLKDFKHTCSEKNEYCSKLGFLSRLMWNFKQVLLFEDKCFDSEEEFNDFVLYFLFEYFTKYGNYIENNTLYTKYCNKLI